GAGRQGGDRQPDGPRAQPRPAAALCAVALPEGRLVPVPSVVLLALPAQRPARLHPRHRHVARRLPLRANRERKRSRSTQQGRRMTMSKRRCQATACLIGLSLLLGAAQASAQQTDPLPSWNDGAAKRAILEFVRVTTDKGSPKYVPPEQRIATFDQDGTLW